MTPQLELVQQWLERAHADLGFAALGQKEPRFTSEVSFHCQQAAEKALKAYLAHHGVDFAWSHDIAYLLNLCESRNAAFQQFRQSAGTLTSYAVHFRYPRAGPDPSIEECQQALIISQEIFDFVVECLPREVRPTRMNEQDQPEQGRD